MRQNFEHLDELGFQVIGIGPDTPENARETAERYKTPFLLLAAACFTKGSHRAKHWLLTHKVFGPYITAFHPGQGLTRQQKWRIGLAFSVTLGASVAMAPLLGIQIFCAAIWAGLMFFLITGRPNHQNSAK